MRALEMAYNIIDRNPQILAFYWHLWTLRDRIDVDQMPTVQMTRQMVKEMAIPTNEEQLLLKQYLELFSVILWKGKIIRITRSETTAP